MDSFIPVEKIQALIFGSGKGSGNCSVTGSANGSEEPPRRDVEALIAKGRACEGLDLDEASLLLRCNDRELIEELFRAAREVKESIYGRRLVLFAPLYISNSCVNDCLYCGFRKENATLQRRILTTDEIRGEAAALLAEGHKRVLLVAAEDPRQVGIEAIEKAIAAVYAAGRGNGDGIRRVNVNVAPLTVEEYRRLKAAGIGTYQLFQETYFPPVYKKMHPRGPKADYDGRLLALGRAQEAGIDDVGMGCLFGLYDYRFEVLALIAHARHLEERFGVGPHTISVPRVEPASHAPLSERPPAGVDDEAFKKVVALLRLAVPYTGLILSTREKAGFRDELLHLGVSQISAHSNTAPGGYTEGARGRGNGEGQFALGDRRTTAEVISDISAKGFTPSFCTACYRVGRTGEAFMEHAKPGHIHRFCQPNALLTFKEYLLDFGDDSLRAVGEGLIREELSAMDDGKVERATRKKLRELERGKRDIYF